MPVKLLTFAQTRALLGFDEREVECAPEETPRTLLERVAPAFDCAGCRVAVDGEYHEWDAPLGSAREVALIPPVSGG